MSASSPEDAPPGMIWRETHPDIGATSIYFSGTDAPKTLVGVAWLLIVIGAAYELVFNVLFASPPAEGSAFAMQAMPLAFIAIGAVFAYKWRIGGPSSSIIEVGPSALRFSRGFWRNPLVIAPAQVRELGVSDHEQNYQVERFDGGGSPQGGYSETARWFQVVLVTSTGERHVVACFGENACAVFYARRLTVLVRDLGPGAITGV